LRQGKSKWELPKHRNAEERLDNLIENKDKEHKCKEEHDS